MGPRGGSHGDPLGCPGIPCGCSSGVPPPTALQACAICENKMAVAAVLWSPHPPRCSHTQSAKKKLLWLQSRGPPPTALQSQQLFFFAKRAGLQPQRGFNKRDFDPTDTGLINRENPIVQALFGEYFEGGDHVPPP